MSDEKQKETSSKNEVNPETLKEKPEASDKGQETATEAKAKEQPEAAKNEKGKETSEAAKSKEKPKGPTAAEQSEKLKKDKQKQKDTAEKDKKKAEKIVKDAIFSKQFPAHKFAGDDQRAKLALAEEAGRDLISSGVWQTGIHILPNGDKIHYIIESKEKKS